MDMGHSKPFGLREIKVTTRDGLTQAVLPASQTMTITPRFSSGELMGDDSIASVVAFIIGADWNLESGGLPLDALAIITGQPTTLSGITPNQSVSYTLDAGDTMPYFKIYGKAVGDEQDDLHAKVFKAKCTSGLEGTFQGESFTVNKCSGTAVKDGANGVIEFVQNETATDLPAS